jgi:thiol-disulfide isomerase/thioredoxin
MGQGVGEATVRKLKNILIFNSMKILIPFVLCICLALQCASQQYIISGNITGFPDSTKFFLKDLDTETDIDSVQILHDSLRMKGRLGSTPQSLWLCTNYNNNFYYVSLLIANDTVSAKGDIKDFPFDLSITGSKIQDVLNILNALTKEGFKRRQQLMTEYFSLPDSAKSRKNEVVSTVNALDSTRQMVTKQFIEDHLNTYPALQYMYFLRKDYGRDLLGTWYSELAPAMKQSGFGLRIANYLQAGDPVKKGDLMEDFAAFDKEGKVRRPSEFKGKYILLDFSTTYCGPCMQSVADMKRLVTAYSDKLAIVSLSGDGGKDTWLAGVDRDRPSWLSLWDGKGVYSRAMIKYGVSGFPTFCLVDPQGRIISVWVGYGKNDDGSGTLEAAVTKVMGK